MFTTEGNLPAKNSYSQTNTNVNQVIRLDETERFEQSYPLNPNGRVSVSNINGSITVEAWDRNEIRLEAVKTADSRETLAEVELRIESRPDSFSIETDYGSWKNRDGQKWRERKLRVDFRLMAPRGAVLDEIESVNGSITLSNFTNQTKASAVNGEIRATNLRGTANLSTVNGTTSADFETVQPNSRISLSTVNGSVNLLLPSDINATVKADTVNGNISNDFGLPVRKGQYVGRDLHGRIGTGEAQINLDSVNGGLNIKRKNDGRNPKPAVDLLPAGKKDEDRDNDSGMKIDTQKLNKEIAKAVSDSQKEKAKALKEAQKEIEKVKPELAKIAVEAITANVEAVSEAVAVVNMDEVKNKLKETQPRQRESLSRLRNINWVAPVMEEKTGSFPVKSTPTVTIEAKNCAVFVRGWDKPEVKYSVRQIGRFGSDQKIPEITSEKSDTAVKIKVSGGEEENADVFSSSDTVRVEVFVPKKSNLRILTNREIRLENVSGDVKLTGGEGAINVRDSDGKLSVSSTEGRIRLIGFSGEVEAKTECGMMNLDGDFKKLSARTVEGTIVLYLPEDANKTIESNRRDIQTEGFALQHVGDGKNTSKWKIGAGGENLLLYTSAEGKIYVRNTAKLFTEE
jgi:DUF4097 and DUF4098 domain-containing protein YvlB